MAASRGPEASLTLGGRGGELGVELLTRGARVHRVRVPTGGGDLLDVVVPREPAAEDFYQGASVGRFANRIAGGDLVVDGDRHVLPTNDRGHTLHGGPGGFHAREWRVVSATASVAELELVSEAGDQGFPGTVSVRATFEVEGSSLRTTFGATTDAATVLSLSSHAYHALGGPVTGHRVQVEADHYLPVDDTAIPTGEVAPVAGTAFDLTSATPVAGFLDHCWVLRGQGFRTVARLEGEHASLWLATDQPGLQVYAGGGRVPGIALEPQHFPDSPHHPEWPSTVLRPGETYCWRSELTVTAR